MCRNRKLKRRKDKEEDQLPDVQERYKALRFHCVALIWLLLCSLGLLHSPWPVCIGIFHRTRQMRGGLIHIRLFSIFVLLTLFPSFFCGERQCFVEPLAHNHIPSSYTPNISLQKRKLWLEMIITKTGSSLTLSYDSVSTMADGPCPFFSGPFRYLVLEGRYPQAWLRVSGNVLYIVILWKLRYAFGNHTKM